MVKKIIILLFFFAKLYGDELVFEKIKENIKEERKVSFVLPESTNILEWTGILFIKLYQTFISSQDKPSCVFHPSCSRYTEEAIKKYGIIKGVIMGAERLERCHPQAFGNYEIHKETGKNYDPLP